MNDSVSLAIRSRLILPCALVVLAARPGSAFQNCTLERVNLGNGGVTALPGTSISRMNASSDGRFVVWSSDDQTIVAGDTNGGLHYDVFVRDRVTGITEIASVDSAGNQGIGSEGLGAIDISDDGRWVVFGSGAQFVPQDLSGAGDIYLRDRLLGQTVLVSQTPQGFSGNNGSSDPAISGDGRFVVFNSGAADLVPNDTNNGPDCFVRDMLTGITERVSVNSLGQQSAFGNTNGPPSISDDGRFVAFSTYADGLAPTDIPSMWPEIPIIGTEADVFIRDRLNGITHHASITPAGVAGTGNASVPSISGDGRRVAFEMNGNLGFGHGNGVYIRDIVANTTELVTLSTTGTVAHGRNPKISGNGRYVLFVSHATDHVLGDTDTLLDSFIRDTAFGITERITDAGASGTIGSSGGGVLTFNGRTAFFRSFDSQSVASDTNGVEDIFMRYCSTPFVSFCPGDTTACPCGNGGAPGGCQNSLLAGGAQLTSLGTASISNDDVKLMGTFMLNGPCMYVQGSGSVGPIVFGDGLLCLTGPLVRLGVVMNTNGASEFPPLPQTLSALGGIAAPGDRTYQVWYRDAATFCTPTTANLTNGVRLTWGP